MLVFKHYADIASLSLLDVLCEVKGEIVRALSAENELLFKLEFLLEELITNSFQHLLPQPLPVGLEIIFEQMQQQIVYREIGVSDLDFANLLAAGEKRVSEIEECLFGGGQGLYLIKRLVAEFSYFYSEKERTRNYTIRIQDLPE